MRDQGTAPQFFIDPLGEVVSVVMMQASYEELVAGARTRDDMLALVFAGVISRSIATGRRPLIRGLSENRFSRLLNEYFPEFEIPNETASADAASSEVFSGLVSLLIEKRIEPTEQRAWLAYAVASSAMAGGDLWQEMGLPTRQELNDVMKEHFPALAAANADDREWKQFLLHVKDQRGISSARQ